MWKKVICLFLILNLIITMVGCWGNPAVSPISLEPENSFSKEFVLVQVIDPESNIIFVTGKENEDAIAILGDKDTEGNPTNITGAVYVSEQGDSFAIEAGIEGLPAYMKDSKGNIVIFKNYTNSTADISIYDSNGNLIQESITINIDPADLLELKQLYNSFYPKELRWSRKNTADALKWGAVGLSAVGCGLALYGTYQTAGFLALTPAVGWACGKASLSLIAAVTPNDTDNIISMAIGTGSCLISGGADVWGCESTILSIIAYGESQSISTIETYTITASAGSHGSINPSGEITVNKDSDKSFTITPDAGYQIADVLVDGSSAGAISSYTFTNITEDHTISASFIPTPVDQSYNIIIIEWKQNYYEYSGEWSAYVYVYYEIENTGNVEIDNYKIYFLVTCIDDSWYVDWTSGLSVGVGHKYSDWTTVNVSGKKAISVVIGGLEIYW